MHIRTFQGFVLPVLAVTLAVGAPCLAPAQAQTDTQIGPLARMLGKTFLAGDDKVQVSVNGNLFIEIKGSPGFVLTAKNGVIRVNSAMGLLIGAVKVDFKVGHSGVMLRQGGSSTVDYLFLDTAGDLHHVKMNGKTGALIRYTRLVDQSVPDAAARTLAAANDASGDPAAVQRALGVAVTQLADSLDGANMPGTALAAATQPAVTQPPANAVATPAPVGRSDPASQFAAVAAGPRVALVVGNGAYGATFGSLANPVNDARAVALALRKAGFEVVEVDNVDQKALKRAVSAFGQRLTAAGRGATGLFYYAGHGVQSRGINYLVPVGAAIESEADIDIEAVAADSVVRQMEDAGASTSIVILDACRNLPVQRRMRDGSRGLARMDAPNGSFIAYSTAPGATASDGTGANSPFASAFIAEIARPGQPIEIVFRNVRRAVTDATGGQQTPWDSSSLLDSFVFTGAATAGAQ